MPTVRRTLISATALLGLALTGMATTNATAAGSVKQAQPDQTVIIHSAKNPRLVLDVKDNSTQDGAPIILYNRHGGTNQRFEVLPVQGDWFQLRSVRSGKCLVNGYHSVANGHQLRQYGCNRNYEDQLWARVPVDNSNRFTLVNKYSGKCADQTTDGRALTNVIQWTCHGLPHQQWTLETTAR
ncbi:RICIN domain-containing protein [Streptomyces smyrnaeus]|uniref:RICIN domain-containing protein n=1 Tax=Streptomyces smyrnaeus TaxID=1387713 RepID=UPI0033B368D0